MIQRIIHTYRLITPLMFYFNRKPRPSYVPTQSSIMLPYRAKRWPKQVGRGPGSGKGKTAGRGIKGNSARSGGGVNVRYEGGQTPIHRRLPKYGKSKRAKARQYYHYVNLGTLEYFLQRGILKNTQKITIKMLQDLGIVKNVKYGVKILSKGLASFSHKINIQVSDASKSAIAAIQKHGGSVILKYRPPLQIRQHLRPERYPVPYRDPIPDISIINKIQRKQKDRNLPIQYRKPKWKIQQENIPKPEQPISKFIYPIPRIPNPQKIRLRKPKLYKIISYKI